MKKTFFRIFLLTTFFVGCGLAFAHQPRLVKVDETIVNNPEISQAFYGELKGGPHIFIIESDTVFQFYAGILVPDLPDANTGISVLIKKIPVEGGAEEIISLLDGNNFKWEKFHEEFANDDYLWGPEYRDPEALAGKYIIEVFSSGNKGKYSLAIGETEQFPLSEIVNTVITLPQIKSEIFGKSVLTSFLNPIGLFIFGPIVGVVIIILLTIFLIKRIKRFLKTRRK
jgi:hypothetical protein